MKTKIYKICGVALALVLVFSLSLGAFVPVKVEADPGEVAWSSIANPGNLLRTGLNMADVEVGPIAVTPDGATLFAAVFCETAIAGVSTTATALDDWALLQSTDGGYNWTATGLINNPGPITGIAISSYFPTDGTMYVAAGSVPLAPAPAVFRSNDSGATFIELKGVPIDSGATATTIINSIAMWPASPYPYIMVGTDSDVWVLQDMPFGNWMDQEIATGAGIFVDVRAVAFAPDFATTNFIWAVTEAGVVTATNSPGAWGTILANAPLQTATLGWNNAGGGNTVTVTAGATGATFSWTALALITDPNVVVGTAGTITLAPAGVGTFVDVGGGVVGTQTITLTAGTVAIAVVGPTTSSLPNLGAVSADIGFPNDYNSSTAPYLWVSLDTGAANLGGVWRVRGLGPPGPSQAILQYGGVLPAAAANDIRNLAVSGSMASATILAGQEDAAAISKSESGGLTWPPTAVSKQPTGTGVTYVVMAPDFATSGLAYVGTSDGTGTESAFQVSRNAGLSWNQSGLIDTAIAVISDIAVVSQDTVFMVTDAFSLWKTTDALATAPIWERILTPLTVVGPNNTLLAGGSLDLVGTSPEFDGDGVDDVVLATNTAALPNVGVMKSADGGDIFTPMGAPALAITALCVVDNNFAFTGAVGNVYRTDDGAYSWLAATIPPAGNVVSFATSPDYANDSTLLVGNGAGAVYRSENSGATFTIVGAAIALVTNTYVAFDPEYATNSLIYAGGDAVIARYNFTATALGWVNIDATIPTGVGAIVPADAFVITEVNAIGTTGTITVLTGSITVLPTGLATIAGVGLLGPALTITAGMGAVPWITTAAGETFIITATANSTSGWFTPTLGGQTTAIVPFTDPNGNTSFFAVAGAGANNPFSLPDAAVTGAAASTINGLLTSPDGTIYGSNALLAQGVERSLNPRNAPPLPAPTFERVIDQLAATATLAGLWLVVDPALDVVGSKNVLFSIDFAGLVGVDRILTYTDTLATTVVLTEPADGTVFPRETAVTMVWEELTGADTYQWQISTDAGFRLTPVDEGSTGYTSDSSGVLAAGRTYYWRVRVADAAGVGDPLLSRWSNDPAYESAAHWTFTTFLGERPWHPFMPMSGVNPSPGATDVPVKPTFQWNGADWATGYDLELADNSAFTGAIKKTLSTTAWTCDPALDYGTTYYWKVKAVSDVTESEWTDVGVFTTVAEVVPPAKVYSCPQCGLEFSTEAALQAHWDKFHAPPPPVKAVTPAYIWAIIGVGALLVVAVIVLILRTRRAV